MEYYAILTSFSFKVYLRSFVIRTPNFDLIRSRRAEPLLNCMTELLFAVHFTEELSLVEAKLHICLISRLNVDL